TAGAASGMLEIDTDIPQAAPHLVQLAANELDAVVAASPASHDFGPVAPDALSAPATVTVTDCTTAAITISAVSILGGHPAAFQPPGGQPLSGVMVAPGGAASWTVDVAPHDTGTRHAVLDLAYDAGVPHVALDGIGIAGSAPTGRGSYLACSTGGAAAMLPV